MSFRVEKTGDGSLTLIDERLEVSYRSMHGAASESKHVFIKPLQSIQDEFDSVRVLELGFGIGTNFRLLRETIRRPIVYWGIESSPVNPQEVPDPVLCEISRQALMSLQTSKTFEFLGPDLHVFIERCDVLDSKCPEDFHAGAVFHDPFAKHVNSYAWSRDVLEWERNRLHEQGVFTTYGAASDLRAHLTELGLHVAVRPGSGGKRESTIASRSIQTISQIGDARLRGSRRGES